MGRLFHSAAIVAGRFILSQCIQTRVLHRERTDIRGPILLACTHVSHTEPAVISCLLNRRIEWMARSEFFCHPLASAVLRQVSAFPINRDGVPVSSIREAIARLNHGRIVGIFPEGGVVTGQNAMFRGGPMKAGVCVIAQRAGVPVVPIVVLGTDKLNCIDPWLPMRRGRLWVNIGRPVMPVIAKSRCHRRAARQRMAAQLKAEFIATYHELCKTCGLEESDLE